MFRNRKTRFTLFLLGFIFISGCYYDDLEELHPAASIANDCVTADTILFSAHVWPILQTYCGTGDINCHGANATGGTAITNYSDVNLLVQDQSLIGTITHDPNFHPMPKGGGKLKDCLIQEIQTWINQGALNN